MYKWLLLVWPLLLSGIFLFGIPYGTWDYGLAHSGFGIENIIHSELDKILNGDFLGWEVLYWYIIKLYYFIFGIYYFIPLIFTFTSIAIISIYGFLRSKFFNLEKIDCVILATFIVANPYVVSRIVAGHIPIYLSIIASCMLLWALEDKSKYSWVCVLIATILSSVSPYGTIFVILITLISFSMKREIYIKASLVVFTLFFINLLAFKKIFTNISLKHDYAQIHDASEITTYSSNDVLDKLQHAKSASLSILELVGAPFREGMDIIYAFPITGWFGQVIFIGANFFLAWFIIKNLKNINLSKCALMLLLLILCCIWYNPLGVEILYFFSRSYPNIFSALSTPSRFLYVLLIYKVIVAGPYLKFNINRFFKIVAFITMCCCFLPPLAGKADARNDQPLSIDLTNKNYSDILNKYQDNDIYIFPNAYWYKLSRNGNYLPWTSREYSTNFKLYYYKSKALNDLLCANNFNGLLDFLLKNNRSVFIISKFESGISYDNQCNYDQFKFSGLLKQFVDSHQVSMVYEGPDFVIFKSQ